MTVWSPDYWKSGTLADCYRHSSGFEVEAVKEPQNARRRMGAGWLDDPIRTATNLPQFQLAHGSCFGPAFHMLPGLERKTLYGDCVGPFTTTTQTSGGVQGGWFRFRRSSPAERCHGDPVDFLITPPSVPNAAASTAATYQGSSISTSAGARGNLMAKWSTTPFTRPKVTPIQIMRVQSPLLAFVFPSLKPLSLSSAETSR